MTAGGREWSYIATQGPLANTCQDFWQMVWEQGVAIIAMVTAEEVRCCRFFHSDSYAFFIIAWVYALHVTPPNRKAGEKRASVTGPDSAHDTTR